MPDENVKRLVYNKNDPAQRAAVIEKAIAELRGATEGFIVIAVKHNEAYCCTTAWTPLGKIVLAEATASAAHKQSSELAQLSKGTLDLLMKLQKEGKLEG